jgi:hypothetical protein
MINSDYFHKIAVDLFEKKKLNESKDACYVILKKQPNDLFANELIGLIAQSQNRKLINKKKPPRDLNKK